MYTQCSKCETVFRLSAEALRAAGGQVRCGRCGEVFSALARLAEDASGFTVGESPLDLETRADEILEATDTHEAVALPPAESAEEVPPLSEAPLGVEIAQLQILPFDDEIAADSSLEFTLPPGELDRIFIETRRNPLHPLGIDTPHEDRDAGETAAATPFSSFHPAATPKSDDESPSAAASAAERYAAAAAERPTAEVVANEFVHPELAHRARADAARTDAARTDAARTDAARTEATRTEATRAEATANSSKSTGATVVPLTRVPGLDVSEDVRQEMLATYAQAELRSLGSSRRQLPRALWIGAAVVLSILLTAQIVHGNGTWLLAHTPVLRGFATPTPNISAYQLRQWGVTGDPNAKGTLRVRASIMNTAAQLQPYPLLRVTLANRFGTRVGAREFEPAEYLGHATARLLAPGERIDATLDILDPGKDAEGFEIDICVRDADKKVLCATDPAAQAL